MLGWVYRSIPIREREKNLHQKTGASCVRIENLSIFDIHQSPSLFERHIISHTVIGILHHFVARCFKPHPLHLIMSRRSTSPIVRVALVLVLVLALTLTLSYVCCVGYTRSLRDTLRQHDYRWILYAIVATALIIGLLGAFCPKVLPLAEMDGRQGSLVQESFAVSGSKKDGRGGSNGSNGTRGRGGRGSGSSSSITQNNLLPSSDWMNTVRHNASPKAFSLDSSIRLPAVVSGAEGSSSVLVQHPPSHSASAKAASSARYTLDIPLTTIDEELRAHHALDDHCRSGGSSPSGSHRTRSYVFRVWVTAPSLNQLRNTTHPFDIRYTTPDTRTPRSIQAQYRILNEPDTQRRQFGHYRWYHLESSAVVFPKEARKVMWRIPASNTASNTATYPTDTSHTSHTRDTRYWCLFEVRHQRDGAADDIEPSVGLQALFTTFLTPNPFSKDRRTWNDESGYHHLSSFVDGPVVLRNNGVRLADRGGIWYGPSSSVLLGQTNAVTSTDNHVTPFTLSFLYTPANAGHRHSKRSDRTSSTSISSCAHVPASSAKYTTLFTVYADHRNWYQYDNPPNYMLRVQVHPQTHRWRVVQQNVSSSSSSSSAGYTVRTLSAPLRNETNDPILYTITINRSSDRNKGDIALYANAQEEVSRRAWIDLNYNLNADKMTRIVWGDTTAVTTTRADKSHRSTSSSTQIRASFVDLGTLYAFMVYSRALDTDEVNQLHRYILRSYYTNQQNETQGGGYRYHRPAEGGNDTSRASNKYKNNTIACLTYPADYMQHLDDPNVFQCKLVHRAQDCKKMSHTKKGTLQYPYPGQDCSTAIAASKRAARKAVHDLGGSISPKPSCHPEHPRYYDTKTGTPTSSASSSTYPSFPHCDKQHPCTEDLQYCDYAHGTHGTCRPCEGACDTEGLTNRAARQDCARVCNPKMGARYRLRTSYTDAEYQALTPTEKLNVLQNGEFVRTARVLSTPTPSPSSHRTHQHKQNRRKHSQTQ